jgi:hypothetical protein
MEKNILSEINRTREIMGLSEQRKETIITDVIKSDVDVPIPPIKGKYGAGSSDPSKFIKGSVVSIMSSLPQKAKDKLDEGKLKLVQITVKAGASNYWDKTTGPTQFDHEIVGNDYEPTTDGKGQGLSKDGYDLNMELAELRASTYIEELGPLLKETGVIVGDKLSKIPQGMVVNTGGKNDDPECTTDCGQVLILTLSFIYTDTIEKTIDVCLPEVQISVGVLGTDVDGHECDEAIFKVSVNGVKIGVANLNNGTFDRYAYERKKGTSWSNAGWPTRTAGPLQGKYHEQPYFKLPGQWSKKRTTDGKLGGIRTWTTTIDTENEKYNWGDENILEITPLVKQRGGGESHINNTLLCTKNTYGGSRPCGSHSEVPNVTIKNTPETAGKFNTVYEDQPNISLTIGSTDTTELLRLDKCGVPIKTETASTEG